MVGCVVGNVRDPQIYEGGGWWRGLDTLYKYTMTRGPTPRHFGNPPNFGLLGKGGGKQYTVRWAFGKS